MLHQAREDKNALRAQLLENQKQIVGLQTQIGVLKQQVLSLEIAADSDANERLRKDHSFQLGRVIHRDDATGEVCWLEPVEK
jgi:hypothetical protein